MVTKIINATTSYANVVRASWLANGVGEFYPAHMVRIVCKKLLVILLTLTLVFGHAAFAPAMALTAPESIQAGSADVTSPSDDHDACCPSCNKDGGAMDHSDHNAKGMTCAAMCAASAQAALPSLPPVFVRPAHRVTYDHGDSVATYWPVLTDSPPPRA